MASPALHAGACQWIIYAMQLPCARLQPAVFSLLSISDVCNGMFLHARVGLIQPLFLGLIGYEFS
jgi:hypothetical protein